MAHGGFIDDPEDVLAEYDAYTKDMTSLDAKISQMLLQFKSVEEINAKLCEIEESIRCLPPVVGQEYAEAWKGFTGLMQNMTENAKAKEV